MKSGMITRLWLAMIRVANMEEAMNFYTNILELPLALDGRVFNHVEIGPREPLAKIGIYETGKKAKRKRKTEMGMRQTLVRRWVLARSVSFKKRYTMNTSLSWIIMILADQ